MGRLSTLARLGALLVLGACGALRPGGAERSDELLSNAPPRGVRCTVDRQPAELPGVDVVVDSARLAAAVAELRRQDPPPAGYVLLTLAFGPDGVNVRRDIIEHTTRPLVADSVQRLVYAARRQVAEADAEWGVRLRVDLTDPVTLRVGRREFCPPVARDRQLQTAMEGFNPPGVRYRGGRRERIVHMRAHVSASGTITGAYIVRGEHRGSALERTLTDYLRQFLFTPATIDGAPTDAWVDIPVRIPA